MKRNIFGAAAVVGVLFTASLNAGVQAQGGAMIDVNYSCRLPTIILAGPPCGRGCDSPAAG